MRRGSVTPSTHNHWKYQLAPGYYLAGRLSEGDPGETIADVWGISSGGSTKVLVFDGSGKANGSDNLASHKDAIESAIENTFGIEISDVSVTINRYQLNDTIEDWDTYEQIN